MDLEKFKENVLKEYEWDLEGFTLENIDKEIDSVMDELSPLEEWLEALTFYKEKLSNAQ